MSQLFAQSVHLAGVPEQTKKSPDGAATPVALLEQSLC